MKILGLIAIVLVTFSACQKENLRPCTHPANQPAAPLPQPQAIGGATGNGESTGSTGNPGTEGGGIVDPNADQDSNTKAPRKGK